MIVTPPTRMVPPVLISDGPDMMPFQGDPDAIIVRLLVGIMSDDPDWIRLRLPVHGLKVIPVVVEPLRNTVVPVNVAAPPPTNDVTTVTVRVTIFEIFPAVSILEYVRIYVPGIAVFTDPVVGTSIVPLPSILSVHDAPTSVYREF